MKTLTNLTGVISDTDHAETRGFISSAIYQPPECPGAFIHVRLGSNGLVIANSLGEKVAVPMTVLLDGVRALIPELFPSPAVIQQVRERDQDAARERLASRAPVTRVKAESETKA